MAEVSALLEIGPKMRERRLHSWMRRTYPEEQRLSASEQKQRSLMQQKKARTVALEEHEVEEGVGSQNRQARCSAVPAQQASVAPCLSSP